MIFILKKIAKLLLIFLPKSLNEKIKNDYHQSIRDKSSPNWERDTNFNPRKKLKIGFVGAGNYAQFHLQSLNGINGVEIDSILSKTGKNSEELLNKFNIKKSFVDIDKFMQRKVDAYIVVSSSNALYQNVKKLFKNGKPILMEKPPGFNSKQTEDLIKLSNKYKTFGAVALNRRFYSDLQNGLAMLADHGPIRGAVLEVPEDISNVRKRANLQIKELDNYFFRNSIHGFDTLRHIMGDVVNLKSLGNSNSKNMNRGLSAGAVVEHNNNLFSTVLTLWDTKPFYWKIKVIGERGYLEFSEKSTTKFTDQNLNVFNIAENKIDRYYRKGNYMQALSFLKSVDKKIPLKFPSCDLTDSLKTMQFMERFNKLK